MSVIIDLTHHLNPSIQVYPGDPLYSCTTTKSFAKDGYNTQLLTISTHHGTHLDAPYHFFPSGATIDQIPLSSLIGPCLVIPLDHKRPREKITWKADLEPHAHLMKPGTLLILRTGWSKFWTSDDRQLYVDHPYLDRDAAERMISTGVRLIAVDTFSPDETTADGSETEGGFGVHDVVLGAGGFIVENLNISEHLQTGDIVHIVPLNLQGGDGSPIRAFACRD